MSPVSDPLDIVCLVSQHTFPSIRVTIEGCFIKLPGNPAGRALEVPRILSEAHPLARKTLPRIPSCGYKLVRPGPSKIKKNSIVWRLADIALRLVSGGPVNFASEDVSMLYYFPGR